MKSLTRYLYFSEKIIEKALKLTTGQVVKDSINFVGHPGKEEMLRVHIWEQIHHNFYTSYCYNKWHNSLLLCLVIRFLKTSLIS